MDYSKLIDIGSKLSLALVLMIILFGGVSGYWVAGSTYRDMMADRDVWKGLALKGTKVAQEAGWPGWHGTQGENPVATPPLSSNPTPSQVDEKLNSLRPKISQPTDAPIRKDKVIYAWMD
jgi:hypothetical protein